MLRSRQGLLLVEAVLSAVLIGVGLIFISRGLGGQLQALARVTEQDRLIALANSKLAELEGAMAFGHAPLSGQGSFGAPDEAYRWAVRAVPRQEEEGEPPACEVTLSVSREGASTVSMTAVWPAEWIPPAWF